MPSSGGQFYGYVDRVTQHEFEHTFGLPDFAEDDSGLKDLKDAIMNEGDRIDVDDKGQLRAIYLLHGPVNGAH